MAPRRLSDRLLSWASVLADNAREQAEGAATLPFITPHLALMPDAHLGRGATVGSVIPTDRAVIPAAVGVDIGCGMIAARLDTTVSDVEGFDLGRLRREIAHAIPLGAGRQNKRLIDSAKARIARLEDDARTAGIDPDSFSKKWRHQLGSLGGGNHFIEVCADERDRIWLFLHSGSRGVGNRIAQQHITVARQRCERSGVELPDRDLAFLDEGTPEFDRYLADLLWAQAYALANREEMMDRVLDRFRRWFARGEVAEQERINTHHNFTQQEHHFGRDLWITRKGAIQAQHGRPGLIPGSMGTRSYVVVGKGNAESYCSAPHGAGRSFSRTEAKRRFTVDDLRTAMAGIEAEIADAFIDEIPAAYKDIDQVMADAADLVEIRHELRQLVNVKGA